uniref:Peptidylprolyl isomerase n=1 Tax=Fundidesulfovibrio putealis TaxID=270496 RepID=A0A7C3WCU7_9BACT
MSAFPFLSALIALCLLLPAPYASAQNVVDKIVAQVNGEMITLFELNERVRLYVTQVEKRPFNPADPAVKAMQERVLQSMIEDLLLRHEAKRLKINVSDSELENRIREIREKAGLSDAQFTQQLRLENMTRKEFLENLKKDIIKRQILGYMVQRKVLVSDQEIQEYYDANKGSLRVETGQRVGLIMLAKMDEAKALRQRIASGQITFAEAARKFSIGPGAEQGGDLGKVELKDMAPELRQAVEGLTPGGVSQPVLLDGKPVILTLGADSGPTAAAQPSGPAPLESVRNEIYEKLYRVKLEKQFTEYMDKLRSRSVIKVNL